MRCKYSISILFVCVLLLKCEAQTFEWISPDVGINYGVDYAKIKETQHGDFFIIGNNYHKVACIKLNKFGKIIWEVSPNIFSKGLTDFISIDNEKSFYVIGLGNAFPPTNIMFNINLDGIISFEKEIYSLTYYPFRFSSKKYKNQLLTCGYSFQPYPNGNPIIEFRGLNGDTLGKKEITNGNYGKAQRIFELKDFSGFLLFCGLYDSPYFTIIQTDSIGNPTSIKDYGKGNFGYRTDYMDLVEKDSSYFLLGYIDFNNTIDWQKRGNYIYQFNCDGDSVYLNKLDDNHASLKAIAATYDKGFIVAGDALIKFDSNYKVEWHKDFKSGITITSVGQAADGGFYGAGSYFDVSLNRYKMYVFKTDKNGNIDGSAKYPDIILYPNPAKNEIKFELPYEEEFSINIFDIQGRNCLQYKTIGSSKADIGFLIEGIYLIKIQNYQGDVVKTMKLIKLD